MPYTLVQWIGFFFFYAFIGWCYESAYVSIKNKRWVNRGFMRGPLLPLYGSGAIVLLFVTIPFQENLMLMYLVGALGATALEYVTGVTMEAIFKVRYWDYTNRRFNFQGHICLAATALWGFFAILLVKVVHKPIENMLLGIPTLVLEIAVMVITIFSVADFALSFKAALDIRDVLIRLEEVQREMERMQKRLDVILAFAEDSKEQVVMNTYERLDDLTDALEERFAQMKALREKLDEKVENELREHKERREEYKEEMEELRINFRIYMEKRLLLLNRKDFIRRDMLLNNPMMVSKQFKNALEDIKKAARERENKKK